MIINYVIFVIFSDTKSFNTVPIFLRMFTNLNYYILTYGVYYLLVTFMAINVGTHVCKYFLTILDDVSVRAHAHTQMNNDHKFLIPQIYVSKGIIHQIPWVKPPQNKMEGSKENITSSNFPKHFGLLHSHMLHSYYQ